MEGWGNYFFYGFSNEQETALAAWKLCDLNAFRLWCFRQMSTLPPKQYPGKGRNNGDGSSTFRAFIAAAIPNFIIASKAVAL